MSEDDDELFRAGAVKPGEEPRITLTPHGIVETTSRGVIVTRDRDGTTQIYGTHPRMATPDA